MDRRDLVSRTVEFILMLLLLPGCTAYPPTVLPGNAGTPAFTLSSPDNTRSAATPTPDPCTGWWCTVTGIVYIDAAGSGNELEGASVTLDQWSHCSSTRGRRQTTSGPGGRFEFAEVFFHDTDRVRIEVDAEGYEPVVWDSKGTYCLYCNCFGSPLEVVLRPE